MDKALVKRPLELDSAIDVEGSPCKRTKPELAMENLYYSPPTEDSALDILRSQAYADTESPFKDLASELNLKKIAADVSQKTIRLRRKKFQLSEQDQMDFSSVDTTITPMRLLDEGETNDAPLFTFSELVMYCQRAMKEQYQHLHDEYNHVLKRKLAEQYETFVKFTHDQLLKQTKPDAHPSYMM